MANQKKQRTERKQTKRRPTKPPFIKKKKSEEAKRLMVYLEKQSRHSSESTKSATTFLSAAKAWGTEGSNSSSKDVASHVVSTGSVLECTSMVGRIRKEQDPSTEIMDKMISRALAIVDKTGGSSTSFTSESGASKDLLGVPSERNKKRHPLGWDTPSFDKKGNPIYRVVHQTRFPSKPPCYNRKDRALFAKKRKSTRQTRLRYLLRSRELLQSEIDELDQGQNSQNSKSSPKSNNDANGSGYQRSWESASRSVSSESESDGSDSSESEEVSSSTSNASSRSLSSASRSISSKSHNMYHSKSVRSDGDTEIHCDESVLQSMEEIRKLKEKLLKQQLENQIALLKQQLAQTEKISTKELLSATSPKEMQLLKKATANVIHKQQGVIQKKETNASVDCILMGAKRIFTVDHLLVAIMCSLVAFALIWNWLKVESSADVNESEIL